VSKRNAIVKRGPSGLETTPPKVKPSGKTYDMVIRVSRRAGRKGSTFISPKEQRAKCIAWIEANGHTLGLDHDETDSVSGKTTDRVGLKYAIERAVAGETSGIVVAKLDRFSRNVSSGLAAIKQLEDAGKDLIAVSEGMTGGAEERTNPTAKLMRTLFLALAEWQWDSFQETWSTSRENHIDRGVHAGVPFGYMRAESGTPLIIDAEAAPYVLAIFVRRAAGESTPSIARWLNDLGVHTATGAQWTAQRIVQVIKSRTYVGEARSGKDLVNPAAHPAIVTEMQWVNANAAGTSTNDRRVNGAYLLRGVVRCTSCGSKMAGLTDRGRRYRCRRTFSWGTCPAPASVTADEVEKYVTAEFFKRYVHVTVAGGGDDVGRLSAAEDELATALEDLRRYRDNTVVRDALEEAGEGLFEEGVTERANRVKAARVALGTIKAQATGLLVPDDLEDNWDTLEINDRRELVAAGFDAVMVKPPGRNRWETSPISERVRVFGRGEAPDDLPGKGGGRLMRPVNF
jgi:DNA invertase Pin-like site-specific DNA recombinase